MSNQEQHLAKLKWDAQGLIPAIIQDAASKDVLMLAYMNEESLAKTLETKETWFWSRSRQELWHKGATSGHIQKVKSITFDCDADTLLIFVEPAGPACHKGQYSCFNEESGQNDSKHRFEMLSVLESVIAERDAERPEGAYTTYLFEQGIDKILKKIGEESAEVIIAAKNQDDDELRSETSDLIFHLMVLLREAKLPWNEVMRELAERHQLKES